MIPMTAIDWARQAQQQTGASDLAAALALAIAGPESGYNPNAVGDGGTSFGLLQFHQGGGLGDAYSASDLMDPVFNLAAGMRYIQSRLDAGASPYEAISPWSTRDAAMANLPEAAAALGVQIPGGPAVAAGSGVVLAVIAFLVILALVD